MEGGKVKLHIRHTAHDLAIRLFQIKKPTSYNPTSYLPFFRIPGRPRLIADEDPGACPELDLGSMLDKKPRFDCSESILQLVKMISDGVENSTVA